MNKLIKFALLIILPSLITFVVGWKIGTMQGADVHLRIQHSLKSGDLVRELDLLRQNRIETLIGMKETELDFSLWMHSLYLEENRGWILFPFNHMYKDILEGCLIKSAEYRRRHPRPESSQPEEEMQQLYIQVDDLLRTIEQ